jgi:hypothetical protein
MVRNPTNDKDGNEQVKPRVTREAEKAEQPPVKPEKEKK